MTHVTRADILRVPSTSTPTIDDTIDEAALPGEWKSSTLPIVISQPALRKATPETVWIRIPLGALADRPGRLDLFLMRWIACGQLSVYGDGHLLYRSGGSPLWNLSHRPPALVHLVNGDDGRAPHTVLLRLDWQAGHTVALSSLYVGEGSAIAAEAARVDLLAEQIPTMLSVTFLLTGLFAFFQWLRNRSFPGHLIFMLFVLGMVWRWHFYMGAEVPAVPDAWYTWITANAALWQVVVMHHLLSFTHGRRQPRMARALLAICLMITVFSLPLRHPPLAIVAQWYAGMYMSILPLYLIVTLNGTWNAWRARSIDAGLLAGSMLIGLVASVIDAPKLMNMGHVENLFLTTYLLRLTAFACVYLMFSNYARAIRQIRVANITLEQRVREREAELALNYEQLRRVERLQVLSDERQRLMQDMHDGLGSSLNSALRVAESGRGDTELEAMIRKCIDDLKLTVDSLEPVDGDLVLLLATLRYRFGSRLQRAGIHLHWEVEEVPPLEWLNPHAALHILRIVQEALANVLQHTRATEIRIATGADEHSVHITVWDNGPGFDVEAAIRKGGRGLSNQLRRAREIKSRLEWHSSETGTRMGLILPRHAANCH